MYTKSISFLIKTLIFICTYVLFNFSNCNSIPEPKQTEKPYDGGEVRSDNMFKYGRFEVRMKPMRINGVISGMFTYYGRSDDWATFLVKRTNCEEIDIEFVNAKNEKNKFEINYHHGELWTSEHKWQITLDYNTDSDFHVYCIDWTKDYIAWYVDGIEKHRKQKDSFNPLDELQNPQHIILNIWTSTYYDWSGNINEYELPVNIMYDWVKHYAWDEATGFHSIPDWEDDFNNLDKWIVSEYTFEGNNARFYEKNVSCCNNGLLSLWLTKRGQSPPITSSIPTQGLVAYYPFDGNANDGSGNGNNGTVYGATTTTDRFGNSDKAYNFNGIDNYIQIPDNSVFHSLNQITLSAWFKATDTLQTWAKIIGKHYDASDGSFYLVWEYSHIRFSAITNNQYGGIISGNLFDGHWHNAVGIYDGSQMSLYIDGILINSAANSGSIKETNDALTIGRSESWNLYYHGSIDDIRIYSRALAASEIQQLYHEGSW
ncbi:MAG: glycosyl hydrolase family protein [Ignavibacteriales bacterium]|nr:MAG: glycosyl hydrolase family protein [Ignavibacteriales bacterium]